VAGSGVAAALLPGSVAAQIGRSRGKLVDKRGVDSPEDRGVLFPQSVGMADESLEEVH
jgi:hypothetical protein